MAHNLDITAGQASFVSAREDAWHGLGTVLPDAFTAADALKHGLLADWNIRKDPITTTIDGQQYVVPDRYTVSRTNPVSKQLEVLGDVGKVYTVCQNEQLTGLLDSLVHESGAHYETAGAIDGGRKVFVTMKLPGGVKIGGVDPVANYIAAMTSHDGSTSTMLMVTPVRIVCQNTLNMAFQNSAHMFKVRHTVGAPKVLLQQAREALDFTFDYLDGFQEEASQLINTELTQVRFEELIAREFGAAKDAPVPTQTRTNNKLDQMAELFADAQTQDGIRGTAWAGLNALTEWYDHFSPVRTGSDDGMRHRKALLDPAFKNDALRLMKSLV